MTWAAIKHVNLQIYRNVVEVSLSLVNHLTSGMDIKILDAKLRSMDNVSCRKQAIDYKKMEIIYLLKWNACILVKLVKRVSVCHVSLNTNFNLENVYLIHPVIQTAKAAQPEHKEIWQQIFASIAHSKTVRFA